MGISLVRYEDNSTISWGLLQEKVILPLEGAYPDLDTVLEIGREDIQAAQQLEPDQGIPRDRVKILAPVTAPARIICQSPNFKVEDAKEKDHKPFFLRKDDSSLASATDPLKRPSDCHLLEGSVMLGMVIGKDLFRPTEITPENIHEYVGGWVICTDLTARDQVMRESGEQLYQSKSYRGFCPTGPFVFLPDADDWKKLNQLELRMWVNDELKEENFTRLWKQQPHESLTELTKVIDLTAGDIFLTGGSPMSKVTPPSGMIEKLGGLLFSEEKRMNAFFQTLAKEGNYLNPGDSIRTTVTSADGTISLGEQTYSIATS